MIKEVDSKQFNEIIAGGESVLAWFSASWCMPCKMQGFILQDVCKKIQNDTHVLKVDIDNCMDLSREYGVLSIPTLVLIKNNQMVEKVVGISQEQDIVDMVDKFLK